MVGATYPALLGRVREAAPGLWFLLPGVGAQGGDLEASLAGRTGRDGGRVLVNVSRAIWQAKDPAAAAREMTDRINACRNAHEHGASGAGNAAAAEPVDSDRIALGLHDLGAVSFGSSR